MFWLKSPLFDEEPSGGGGGIAIDPGAPHELDHEEPEPAKKPAAEPAAIEKDLADLRGRVTAAEKAAADAKADAQYWAERARRPAERTEPEPRQEPEPRRTRAADEKPEKVLDDMTVEGVEALRKRGFITAEEMEERLAEVAAQADAKINATYSDASFDMQLNREFPEVGIESAKIAKGERATDPLFIRAGEIYRESIALDPNLKGSKSALLIACRQARSELKGKDDVQTDTPPKKKSGDDPEKRSVRRERIERQMPERGRASGDESDDTPSMSGMAKEMGRHLGLKDEDFHKQRQARNGR